MDYGLWLSVTSLAAIPIALRDILQTAYMLLRNTPLLHPGLSAIADWTAAPLDRILYGLLGRVDAFTVWLAILLLLGAAVSSRFGRLKAGFSAFIYLIVAAIVASLPAILVGSLLGR